MKRPLPGHSVAQGLQGVIAVHHGVYGVVHTDEPAAGHDEVGEAEAEEEGEKSECGVTSAEDEGAHIRGFNSRTGDKVGRVEAEPSKV